MKGETGQFMALSANSESKISTRLEQIDRSNVGSLYNLVQLSSDEKVFINR